MKIDVTKIEGYADMTPEEKLAALEAYEIADPDYSGYVKKDVFDKKASEAAEANRKLKEHMSQEELEKAEREKAEKEMKENYEKLLHESNVSKAKARYLALSGFDDKLAEETAEAFVSGDTDKVFANQKKAQQAFEKQLRADILKGTPKPEGSEGGAESVNLGERYAKQYNSMYAPTQGEE